MKSRARLELITVSDLKFEPEPERCISGESHSTDFSTVPRGTMFRDLHRSERRHRPKSDLENNQIHVWSSWDELTDPSSEFRAKFVITILICINHHFFCLGAQRSRM